MNLYNFKSWTKGNILISIFNLSFKQTTYIMGMLLRYFKHALHCISLTALVTILIGTSSIQLETSHGDSLFVNILFTINLFGLIPCILQFLGLITYNCFPEEVKLKSNADISSVICFRTVTRGDYPNLVKTNILRNANICLDAGLKNFRLEVVTDKLLDLPKTERYYEIVVPPSYQTKTGAMYKARALQYCLEDNVNVLADTDWIVHLDEETILTEESVRGIINFVQDGRHQFGQGIITYANEEIVNWITTLADVSRVAEDYGRLRFELKTFHRPLLSIKGAYVVSQVKAEQAVSYDNGPEGSIAEDTFFGMAAVRDGFSFDFIEGEMWEKSPFSIWDFINQRKRWMQGLFLVINSRQLPCRAKFFLCLSIYSFLTIPFIAPMLFISGAVFKFTCTWRYINILNMFMQGVVIYSIIFGLIKSFSYKRFGVFALLLQLIGAFCVIPVNLVLLFFAEVMCFGNKYTFYIVAKEIPKNNSTV